jgi:hypothetical protein
MDLLIPGHAAEEFDATHDIAVARAFDEMLKTLDPRLRCFWVKADSVNFENPGRWHVGFFHSNPELRTYFVVQDPDGSYCEPSERHFEELKRRDSWTRNAYSDIERARAQRKGRAVRAFEEKRREFREKLLDRLGHIHDSRISVPRAIGETGGRLILPAGVERGTQPKKGRL